MRWTVKIYDVPTIVKVLLHWVADLLVGKPLSATPLETLIQTVQTFMIDVLRWVQRLYLSGYGGTSSLKAADVAQVRSLPDAYRKLLDDMGPFFLTPAPRNEQEHRQFLNVLDEVRQNLAANVMDVTQWRDVLELLLDAGFHPWDRALSANPATVENMLGWSIDLLKRKPVSFMDVAFVASVNPLYTPIAQWVGRPVTLGILTTTAAIYAQHIEQHNAYRELEEMSLV